METNSMYFLFRHKISRFFSNKILTQLILSYLLTFLSIPL